MTRMIPSTYDGMMFVRTMLQVVVDIADIAAPTITPGSLAYRVAGVKYIKAEGSVDATIL